MGIFGQNQAGQARYSGELHNLQLTQSVFGTTAPIIFGTRRVAGKLLFYGGFYAVPAPGQGKGLGGGKSNQEFEYYADVLLALASGSASGGCPNILNIWDQQGRLYNYVSVQYYTVPGGGGTLPASSGGAPLAQQDLGVTKAAAYSVVANDFGAGGSQTLTGSQDVPMQRVTGTPSAGQYSFTPASPGSWQPNQAFALNATILDPAGHIQKATTAGTSGSLQPTFNDAGSTTADGTVVWTDQGVGGTGAYYTFAAADAGAVMTVATSSAYSLYYFVTTQPAQVPLSGPYTVSTNNQSYFYGDIGVVRVDTGAALVRGTDYNEASGVYTFASYLAGVYVYINYEFTSNDSAITNSSTFNLTFLGGSVGQSPWAYMTGKYPGSNFGYTGLCYIGANPMALGESATLPCYNYEVMGLNIHGGRSLDAHPCDAFRTLLYDAFLGVGFPSANVDAWTSCYAYWAANAYLFSKALDTQTSVADAMKEVIEAGNVGAVWSGGLLKLIPYGDATCVGGGYTYTPATTPVATLTWNDMLPPSDEKAGTSTQDDLIQVAQRAPQDCWNYVQAQWCNRLNDYNNELINEQNDAFINDYGRRIESPQAWDWITTQAAATWALNLRLKRQCYIRNTSKFWLPFWFSYIEPMDIVTLPTGENVRIASIEDAPDGRLAFEAEQFSYGTGNVTVYPKQAPSSFMPTLSSAQPGDAVPIVVQNTVGQGAGVAYQAQIAAAGNGANWGGCNVYTSLDGQTYTQIGTVYAPSVLGMLSAALASSGDPDLTDTLSVDLTLSQSSADLVGVTQLLADKLATLCAIVDQGGQTCELVSYETATLTAAGRYNLTYLRRGAFGSIPAAHSVGALFAFLGPNYKFANYQFGPSLMGHTLYIKLQSFNLAGKQLQNLANCAAWQYTLGFETGQMGIVYSPSAVATSFTGSGATITNANSAFDGNFSSAAVLDSGPFATASNGTAVFSGFPSVTLTSPATLFISYRNLAGFDDVRPHSPLPYIDGGQAWVWAYIGGSPVGGPSWLPIATGNSNVPTNVPPTGTASVTIPAGTNLSSLTLKAFVQNLVSGVGGASGQVSGHIEILQIWVQSGQSQLNTAALAVPVPFASTQTFDLSQGVAQSTILTGNVTSSSVINPSNSVYTFAIIQDGTGGHSFAWPSNFYGGGGISAANGTAAANTAAVQSFLYIPASNLFVATGPMTITTI